MLFRSRRISPDEGERALTAWAGGHASPAQVRTAVRYTLEALAEAAPGNSVEVRVPPAGVTQVIAGPRHTRGTPPNTIEMPPDVWLALATGRLRWAEAVSAHLVESSGVRATLEGHLPVVEWPDDGITSKA